MEFHHDSARISRDVRAAIRPFVAAIALASSGSAPHGMEGPATVHGYATRVPVVVLVAWLTGRSVLGLGKCVFSRPARTQCRPWRSFADPVDDRCRGPAAVGKNCKLVSAIPLHWIVAAQSIASEVDLPRPLGGRTPALQFALPAGIGDVMTGCLPSSWQCCWRKRRQPL